MSTLTNRPPAAVLLIAYSAIAVILGYALVITGNRALLLVLLAVPALVAAIHYPRAIYWTMIAVATLIAGVVLYIRHPALGAVLAGALGAGLGLGAVSELVHWSIGGRVRAEEARRLSEERYRLLFERSLAGVYRATHDGAILDCNEAFARIVGYANRDELIGCRLGDLYHDPAEYDTLLTRLRAQQTVTNHEVALRRRDGTPRWALENISFAPGPSGTTVIDGALIDISPRKEAEEQLRLQAAALAAAANAIVIADRTGCITWVNPAFARLTGYSDEEALDPAGQSFLAGADDPAVRQAIWDTVQAGQVWHGEVINRRKDGSFYTEEQTITPVRDAAGEITHFISIKQDIEERKQNERRLGYLARHDTLTGLLNRHALEEALDKAILHARQGAESVLLFLDLDSFKLVNDTLGHAAGDKLLTGLAQLLAQYLRDGDLLARIGGDNFAVLLENTRLAEGRDIAERLREKIHAYRFTLDNHRFMLGLSIGVVRIDGRFPTQQVMAQADMAQHTAKDQGRNRVVLYHPEETNLVQLSRDHQWVSRIKEALWEDRFLLHFQPIVRLSDGAIAHYEALIRMRHEDQATELILPGTFIPVAERFGLMPAIDAWLVRRAILTLHQHPDIHLFINLSGLSRGDDGLLELIESLLREYAVSPHRLGFELTETVAVQDLLEAKRWIGRLKALGCRFALDDFGVGYTSFAYLRSLPVDQIKIDGSFIRTLDQDTSSREIVQTMLTLANSLGKETVAEFVESETIYRALQEMGVTYAQGFYLGQPGPDLPRFPPPPSLSYQATATTSTFEAPL